MTERSLPYCNLILIWNIYFKHSVGEDIPEWFAFKSVVNVLREAQK